MLGTIFREQLTGTSGGMSRGRPYPEQLYLEVCGLIFKEKEESTD